MVMIKIFLATDTDYTTNGEGILKPTNAVITKTQEEEYIKVEASLKYAELLLQDNILIVDTITGIKGYRIHNPVTSNSITVKAWLIYEQNISTPADRGVVISHGKNLENCEVTEDWDKVVTKLIPIGYKDVLLPEGFLSVVSPYQKIYEKTLEFKLSETHEEAVEALEETIEDIEAIVNGLTSSMITLQAKYDAYGLSISSLQNDKTTLEDRLSELGTTEPELKEKAIIDAQIPLIELDINNLISDKNNTYAALIGSQTELNNANGELAGAKANYDSIVYGDLRTQAQTYLNVNQYPQINYNLEAHLDGVVEVGDTVHIKHPDMRVDLLTTVTSLEWNCLSGKFNKVEFGTMILDLKGTLAEIKEAVIDNSETIKKTADTVNKYRSEYKRDNEELLSRFTLEMYGSSGGIYGLLQKYQSVFRQTASEISGTVSRVNADLSTQVASLRITADAITASVASNFVTLDGKITANASLITQTASQIRSEVSSSVTSLDGKISSNTSLISQTASQIRSEVNSKLSNYSTTTQMNSAINQSATSITSTVNTTINGVKTDLSEVEQTANKISWLVKSGSSSANFTLTDRVISLVAETITLTGYVKFNDLANTGSSVINGANISTGTFAADKITTGALSAYRISGGILNCSLMTVSNLSASAITTGILDASRITVTNLNASNITSGVLEVSYIRANGYRAMNVSGNVLTIGGTSSVYAITNVYLTPSTCVIGANGGTLGFFGSTGAYKRAISLLSSGATLSLAVSKINELIGILKDYKQVA
jgi:hypothetical protein